MINLKDLKKSGISKRVFKEVKLLALGRKSLPKGDLLGSADGLSLALYLEYRDDPDRVVAFVSSILKELVIFSGRNSKSVPYPEKVCRLEKAKSVADSTACYDYFLAEAITADVKAIAAVNEVHILYRQLGVPFEHVVDAGRVTAVTRAARNKYSQIRHASAILGSFKDLEHEDFVELVDMFERLCWVLELKRSYMITFIA